MNQSTEQKIDCVVRVVTPENIEFEYLLAGPFQRLPAFAIDLVVRLVIFGAVVIIGLLVGIPMGGLGVVGTLVVAFLGFFVLSWLYGMVLEAQLNGRTVGKILLGLRVISTDGRPIDGSQAALRNLLRVVDLWPPLSLSLFFPGSFPASIIPTFFVGLLSMTLTSRMQRIGDLAAGTMVVWDGRRGLSSNLQPEDVRAFALAEHVPPTFQISRTLARAVGLYMERRRYLSPQRRQEIAINLAQPLFAIFDLRADTSADLLLCALYVRIYHSEQQRAAKLQTLRGQQFVRPTRDVPPRASLHGSTDMRAAAYAEPPRSDDSAAHQAVAGQSMPDEPSARSMPLSNLHATLVPALPVSDDRTDIIEAQAIEPELNRSADQKGVPL